MQLKELISNQCIMIDFENTTILNLFYMGQFLICKNRAYLHYGLILFFLHHEKTIDPIPVIPGLHLYISSLLLIGNFSKSIFI